MKGKKMDKAWWKSSTVWFNVILGIASIFGAQLNPEVFNLENVGIVAAFVNLILRVWKTRTNLVIQE